MMKEEPNPIKDLLIDYFKHTPGISKLVAQKKFNVIINNIVKRCHDKVLFMGEYDDDSVGIMATVLLHYLLTCAQITSQRKVVYNGIDLDIVIPGTKTLQKDPKKTLIICIPKSSDHNTIQEKIAQLEKIQPFKENIWVVLSKDMDIGKKSFVLKKTQNTFANIIFEIAQFSNVNDASKFKILRI